MTEINLREVRISYPHLFEPFSYQGQGVAKYSAKFLIPKTNTALVSEIVAALKALATASYKDKKLPPADKLCLRDGDLSGREEDAGHWVLSSSESRRPVVVDQQRAPLRAEDDVIYPGCYVNAKVRLWAQDNQYGKRLNANLMGVQFLRDGERFGNGAAAQSPEEMFGDAASFGGDDDSPF